PIYRCTAHEGGAWVVCTFSSYSKMWYFRKLGWFVGVAFGVSAVIAHWYHTSIESHASSPLGQTLLQLAIAAVFGLLFLEVNIRLIYWFGADEFNQRIEAQWKERILAHAENRRYHAKG